jgi:glutaredoxin
MHRGYCKQAKRYLAEKSIHYSEYDIDTPDGMRAFIEAGEVQGVPVMPWSGQRVQGYSKAAYDALFTSAR